MRLIVAAVGLGALFSVRAGSTPIPNMTQLACEPAACTSAANVGATDSDLWVSTEDLTSAADATPENPAPEGTAPAADPTSLGQTGQDANSGGKSSDPPAAPHPAADPSVPVDAKGDPVPLERRQPQRILGVMPNFRSVSGGAKPHPPGWKYNFTVATHQATDYSSFIFLGLTSLTAEGTNEHSALGKGVGGFYAYTWRGFLDKSDNTYLSAWLLPSALHEDTRYYALGAGHSIPIRALYVISRQGVARTYGGQQTPNIAGLGGKALTQVVSRYYYPPSATTFLVLASKFGYSVMRDVIFSSIREFYPDAAAHFIRKHKEKTAATAAALDASIH
ncbi:MAG: hypothetical protein WB341_08950 [Terracidiphilus sp.]